MMKLLYLMLCFGTWQWQNTLQLKNRISNGEEASIKDYSYQVGLKITYRNKKSNACSGTLISRKFILTAAHCLDFYQEGPKEIRILMGSERSVEALEGGKLKPGEQSQRCKKGWKKHPNYFQNKNGLINDIAIIRLRFNVKVTSTVQPISLPKQSETIDDLLNKTAVVSGWGLTEKGVDSPILKAINITILKEDGCPEENICYVPVDGKSDCRGDSGGAVVMNRKIIGIVSYGKTLSDESIISVYTRVGNYLQWIHQVTRIPIED